MDAGPHIFDLDPTTLREHVVDWGLPAFRAIQVLDWVYKHGVIDPEAMTNIARHDRAVLAERLRFASCDVMQEQLATDGVRKLLVQWRQHRLPLGEGGGEGSASRVHDDSKTLLEADGAPHDRSGMTTAARSPHPAAALPTSPEGIGALIASDARRQTECVMIPAGDGARRTACISSQVGCPVGCRFCASGLGGLDGNLTAGRIVEQVWLLGGRGGGERAEGGGRKGGGRAESGKRKARGGNLAAPSSALTPRPSALASSITHVVFMGMGEPLANYEHVVRAVRTLTAEWGLHLSSRRITISTVGLPSQIRRLADEAIPATLAISLHAPNDAIRRQLIPWAQYVTIDQLIEAGRYYFERTGREVTLEYTLMREVNDRPAHAQELARVCKQLRSNVNLIRYNEVQGLPYRRPLDDDVLAFQRALRAAGVNTHIRASRGRDIAAACGQLRHEAAPGSAPTLAAP